MNVISSIRVQFCAAALAATAAAQWGPIPMTTAPDAQFGALLAYDMPGNRSLLLGGNAAFQFWQLAGGTWSQLPAPPMPPRRYARMVANPFSGEMVLYGGLGGGTSLTSLDDTWTWNGTAWSLAAPTATPGGLANQAMAFDALRQVVVLVGGRHSWTATAQLNWQTWEFANGNWTLASPLQSPPALVEAAMAWHPATGQMLMFGGADGQDVPTDATWTYDGTTWQQINTTGPRPSARIGAQLVSVIDRAVCLLVGGRDPVTMEILNDTWEHDGTAWHQVTGPYASLAPARVGAAVAYDLVRHRVVSFGGKVANNEVLADTWEYGAQLQRYGYGCAGTAGVPRLLGGALPVPGTVCTATIDQMPAASPFALMAIGTSRTQWAGGSLPLLLTPIGMTECRSYTSFDLIVGLSAAGGAATWSFGVPPTTSIFTTLYLQGISFDPGANPAWLTVSNALAMVVGH